MTGRLLIIGAGGHGRSVAEAVLLSGERELAGFADDGWQQIREVWGYPVLGSTDALAGLRRHADRAIVAIGNNAVRERIFGALRTLGIELATVIHPTAIVSPRATLGAGCALMAGSVVGTEARLGNGVIVNSGATVDHHCTVEDFGHLGVNACMAGGSMLGQWSLDAGRVGAGLWRSCCPWYRAWGRGMQGLKLPVPFMRIRRPMMASLEQARDDA